MNARPLLIVASLALLTACGEDPGVVGPEAQLARGGGGPPLMATAVATGRAHACAIGVDRTTYCWGQNFFGQLGDGSLDASLTPVPVSGGTVLDAIAGGGRDHTCGLTASGEAWCWGWNAFGQLGDGSTTGSSVPVRAAPGLTFANLDVGTYHTCGVSHDGTTYCWGANGPLVQGGTQDGWAFGTTTSQMCDNPFAPYRGDEWPCSPTPVSVPGPGFVSVHAGLWATCGLTSSGEVYCAGWNVLWALGTGTMDSAPSMTPAAGGLSFDAMDLGAIVGCGLIGTAGHCWGARAFANGTLGNGTQEGSSTPTPVAGGHSFADVTVSDANNVYTFACGRTAAGEVLCWGTNRFGGLGTDAPMEPCLYGGSEWDCSPVPVPVAGGHTFVDLAAGNEFACGVARNRHVYCWGRNFSGQLGDGTTENRFTPVAVRAPERGRSRPAPSTTATPIALIP